MITYVFDSCDHQISLHRATWRKPMHEMLTDGAVIAQLSALPGGLVDCELHRLAGYSWPDLNNATKELNEARLLNFIKGVINGEYN